MSRKSVVILNGIDSILEELKDFYRDNKKWEDTRDVANNRKLTIANLDKCSNWFHGLPETDIEILGYKGYRTVMKKAVQVMKICAEQEYYDVIWKPRFVLSVFLMIGYVENGDWLHDASLHRVALSLQTMKSFIRPSYYYRHMGQTKYNSRVRAVLSEYGEALLSGKIRKR